MEALGNNPGHCEYQILACQCPELSAQYIHCDCIG